MPVKGKVFQINVKPQSGSERGLPKSSVLAAFVTAAGLEGDFNRWRQEKGGGNPDMAVLLMPLETIRQLNREGWPVKPGDIGENITTEGIVYGAFQIGGRYKIGDKLLIEVSQACEPCGNLSVLPCVGSENRSEFIRTMIGRRGWYGRVLQEGWIKIGDAIAEQT